MKSMPFLLLMAIFVFSCSHKPKEKAKNVPLLTEAYTYGFPLVLMDLTRENAPVNQFVHTSRLPDATSKQFTRPNQDTFLSSAWIDLSAGPQVIEIPNTKGRFYFMSMLDAWTNVYASAGKRTLGNSSKKIVLIGPKWNGSIPSGVELVRSPTDITWIVGRIEVKNPQDIKAASAIQKSFRLYSLENYGKKYVAPRSRSSKILGTGTPQEKIFALSTEDYFNRLNRLMLNNPPATLDKETMARFAPLGIAPGAKFRADAFSDDERSAINNIPQVSKANFENNQFAIAKERNGWLMPHKSIGSYVKDYNLRANVAYRALGAPLPLDMISAVALNDGNGDKLTGAKSYILHFNKDQIPLVKGFWSLTVYGQDYYFVKNAMKRYSLGNRGKLKYNSDGSLDIYLQNTAPNAEVKSNWIPTPAGDFSVTARLYSPAPELLDEKYALPAIMPSGNFTPVSMTE